MRKLIIAAALMLSGCATGIMEGFVGQPLQAGIARYGPPDLVFDMPDGRRAFQWRMESDMTMPVTTSGQMNIYAPPGAFATVNHQSTTYGGNTVTQVCRYTMYARWVDASNAWIFESFEKPSMMCL